MRTIRTLSAALILSCFCTTGKAQEVIRISDGDTVTIYPNVKIRLFGIDCPEKDQPFGWQAKAFTTDLVLGRTVTVYPHATDRYGRTVAEVILPDGRSLEEELVKSGLAWWYRKYDPGDLNLESLEMNARSNHRGLWGLSNPYPPWAWRQAKRNADHR